DGTIYAGRDLIIQKDVAGTRAASVTNQIGTIEAGNDLTIRTTTLTNQGSNPTVQTRTTSDGVPYTIISCADPGDAGCVNTGSANAAGETIYNSAWGFQAATVSEVQGYFDRNPRAPTYAPNLQASSFVGLVTTHRGDPHEREGGWSVWRTSAEQYLYPGAVIKSGKLLAGR
ncbi:MAG: hypothetical protein J0626_11720, partial [Rhodospirillaceae bacterium]|nr:hypothetical protein [Rhodospirillaceae bacterium]